MSEIDLYQGFEHSYFDLSKDDASLFKSVLFNQEPDEKCLELVNEQDVIKLKCNYYIGVDWIAQGKRAIFVSPKINTESQETDFLKMLFSCMKHPDIAKYTNELYQIKSNDPYIPINQKQDLITPLLIISYLNILKLIVRKGLKKSYYKVEKNLSSRIKGKVIVSKTLKENVLKNKLTQTICNYEEFGVNCLENKILKYALKFAEKYLCTYPKFSSYLLPIINFCTPAFHEVDVLDVDVHSIKKVKTNKFFKEYKEALNLAEMILKRFGYNLKEIDKLTVRVPPFWIDMPKLFELYVLGLLKDRYGSKIQFQAKGNYGEPDFLLNAENEKIIIDTKYKRIYQGNESSKSRFNSDDIRQICGYARDKKILSKLGYETTELQNVLVDCLIIYPDQNASEELPLSIKQSEIEQFIQFYKMAIKLPTLSE
ncbi:MULTISPECIES: McrC family protein [Acinetobacter]|uniref:McrC family protein n=1 Tax=Acinetobacter TaxID=469 RepID=UPI0020061CEA|nr:McrC family protein [Acinetobacter radioresistens]MCK4080188.1 hypothetical protein [Acinetobacter radioresistens]